MATNHWLGGDATFPNDWNTAANWSLGHVPQAGEDVVIANSAYKIDAFDASATLLGDVYFGKEMANVGDYGAGTPAYLKIACQQNKRIVIHGSTKGQQLWLQYSSANSVNVDIAGFGEVAEDEMVSAGIHLKNSGAGAIARVVNSGGALTCESGTISTIEVGGGNTVVNAGVSVLSFRAFNQLALATLLAMPTTTLAMIDGEVTVESSTAIQTLSQSGGTLIWNGGADITTPTIYKGIFDASGARRKPTFTNARFLGTSTSTIINLRNGVGGATFTDYEIHGTPTILQPEGMKLQPA